MKKILFVFGTRPEAIKLCPLIVELKKRGDFDVKVCSTGQHSSLLSPVLELFSVVPDYDLAVMKEAQTPADITGSVLSGVTEILNDLSPDLVIVHGDTTSAYAAALASFYKKIPVAHVEAGLRTGDKYSPFPEEFNRKSIAVIADYNFAPTEGAKQNLISEGVGEDRIFVTGNTVIDALKYTVGDMPEEFSGIKGRIMLVTAHRRESFGEPIRNIFRAVADIVDARQDVTAIIPIHRNPNAKSAAETLRGHERIILTEPMETGKFHSVMSRAYLILTDSGGIQEEAAALGVPVLVAREVTERQEGIEKGNAFLVGRDRKQIAETALRLLDDVESYKKAACASDIYGDGTACVKIADLLSRFV